MSLTESAPMWYSSLPPSAKARHASITESLPQLAEQWDLDLNIDEKTGSGGSARRGHSQIPLQGLVAPALPCMR